MYLTPVVIEQTNRGERSFDIYSRLLKDRIILVFGEINDALSASIIAQLLFLSSIDKEKEAAMIFVKWLTEKSGYCYNEGGLPVIAGNTDTKLAFDNVSLIEDEAALKGEEDYLNDMNSESELNINNSGNDKIQAIIESASKGDKKFDDIMKEWNKKWSDAQNANGIKVTD